MKLSKSILLLLLFCGLSLQAQSPARQTINIPDILGYKTLKCDFHLHTVFSDGDVWPTVRVEEAWMEGLDAIAITDHLEYQPKKNDIPSNHNRSYEIALEKANQLGIILIKGSEITRGMPPGHLNALFIKDSDKLIKDDWKEVITETVKQGGLIFLNHPGWNVEEAEGKVKFYDEHLWLMENNFLTGIEVINNSDYYPHVLNWCREKGLTLVGNSDAHAPMVFEFNFLQGRHRPMNLVFAEDKSATSIKEALIKRRNVVFANNCLYGEEKYLLEIFNNSLSFNRKDFSISGRKTVYAQISNRSDITYELVLTRGDETIEFPKELKLEAGKTTLLSIRPKNDKISLDKEVSASYLIKNLVHAPGEGTPVQFIFKLNVTPKPN